MGKNKIKIERISNLNTRMITFYKRRRGLLKKAAELATLCNIKIILTIINSKGKKVTYRSNDSQEELIQVDIDTGKNKLVNKQKNVKFILTLRLPKNTSISLKLFLLIILKKSMST